MNDSAMVGPDGLVKTVGGVALSASAGDPCCCGQADDSYDVMRVEDCCAIGSVLWLAIVPLDPGSNSWPSQACRRPGSHCSNPPLDHSTLVQTLAPDGSVLACWFTDPTSIRPADSLTEAERGLITLPVGAAGGRFQRWVEGTCASPACPTCPGCCAPHYIYPPRDCGQPLCCACGTDWTTRVRVKHTLKIFARPAWYRPEEVLWAEEFLVRDHVATAEGWFRVHCENLKEGSGSWRYQTTQWALDYVAGCDDFVSVSRGAAVSSQGDGPWGIGAMSSPINLGCGAPWLGNGGYPTFIPPPWWDDNWTCVVRDPFSITESGTTCAGTYEVRSTFPLTTWQHCTTTWSTQLTCSSGSSRMDLLQEVSGLWDAVCVSDACHNQCDHTPTSVAARFRVVGTYEYEWSTTTDRRCTNQPCGQAPGSAEAFLEAVALG